MAPRKSARRWIRVEVAHEQLARLDEARVDLQEDTSAGAVDLVDALEVEHDERDPVPKRGLHAIGEIFRRPEEDRSFVTRV